MRLAHWSASLALALISASSMAARPTSIVFQALAETPDGQIYGQYTVKCNDGRTVPLTAWDGNRKWCLGDAGTGDCQKKQINAARSACEDNSLGDTDPAPTSLPLAAYSR